VEALGVLRDGRVVRIPIAGHNVGRDIFAPYRYAVVGFLGEVVG
jgi:hypothetical protein